MESLSSDYIVIDYLLLRCYLFIILEPTIWNIIARLEYNTHFLTKIFRNKYIACYFLAICIFIASQFRYNAFLESQNIQPSYIQLLNEYNIETKMIVSISKGLGMIVLFIGSILLITSYWRLGITGTYLGDYFGILMEEKISGFPFNVVNDPMYLGSSLLFLARGLWEQKFMGIITSVYVFLVYKVAVTFFEGPFTQFIYAQRDLQRQKEAKKAR